jgi:surface antigen
MKFAAKTAAIVMAGSISVSACETNEEWGQLMGAVGGAALGMALAGDDDDTMVAIAAIAGASLGAWIGGNIGRGLDEKERERLAGSTQQVLAMEVPAASPLRAPNAAAAPIATAPSAAWTSPTNPTTVSGKTTLLQVAASGSTGECRKVRQLVVKNGAETTEDVEFCRQTASSQWQPTQA